MEWFQADFLLALLSIIIIDVVLAGDNAIVIGLAARNVAKDKQKMVILWGTAGAIVIRALVTMTVVWLLQAPGLLFIGGILLVWIAYRLLTEDKNHDIHAENNVWIAIRTIILADVLMGIDNILAVAGASNGNPFLVIIGLLISVPMIVWGSTVILKFVDRYPIIITIGAGILIWTAAKMIVEEPVLSAFFKHPIIKFGFEFFIVVIVVTLGIRKKRKYKEYGKNINKKDPPSKEKTLC